MHSRLTISTISLLAVVIVFAQVDSIAVQVLPPFPEEKGIVGFGYSLLNALHLDSRPWTVKRLCPIKTGDTLTASCIQEAERIMRSYPFWNDAKIFPLGDSSAVNIIVQELWTTKLNLSVKYVADRLEWGCWMEEENFAGLGAYASGGYANYIDKSWWETSMKVYGFPTHKWDLSAYYNRNDQEWSAGGRFFRNENYINAANLLFLSAAGESVSVPRYYSGAVAMDTIEVEKISAAGEYLIGKGRYYLGIAVGYLKKSLRTYYSDEPFSSNTYYQSYYPAMLRLSYLSRKFFQTRNVDNFVRIEDIPLGLSLTAAVGLNSGHNKHALFTNFAGAFTTHNLYSYIGLKYKNIYDYKICTMNFRAFSPLDSNSIFRLGAGIDIIWLTSDFGDKFLVADGRTGFRGFPAYYEVTYSNDNPFTKLSTELRLFPRFEIFTLRPGIAFFVDAGGADWTHGWMIDFGMSLRICSTRSSRGNVNRFSISYSPQTKTIGFIVDSGQALSFYFPLGLSSVLD